MRIAIIGAGAVGSVLAGLLELGRQELAETAGQDEIWLVGAASTQAHLEAIRSAGLRFELSEQARQRLKPAHAGKLLAGIKSIHLTVEPAAVRPADLAIVLVKSSRTVQAAEQAGQLLAPQGLALTLQNGLGNTEILTGALGPERVSQGSTLLGAGMAGPGIAYFASLNTTYLAAEAGLPVHHRNNLDRLKTLLEAAGAPVEFTANIESTVWSKLALNCTGNAVAALLDLTNGQLAANPPACELMRELCAEFVRVATAAGKSLNFPYSEIFDRVMAVLRANADNYCSMAQDLRRGGMTEIDALNGALVREADRLGLSLPVHRTITDLVRARQSRVGSRPA